ncbi:MAG: hypothetical protein NTU61_03310 [Candidatus Altiarchaeota archaeon]|nr:hypothetical protein [Candidatus Altiarchaeota archaeon]
MRLFFVCDRCQEGKFIDDPVATSIPCECGGSMGVSLVQQHTGKRKQDARQVNPSDERTTLMSMAFDSTKPAKQVSQELYHYKTAMCPKCGWIQVTQAEKSLKCRRCNKISVFRSKGRWNVKVKSFPTHEMACTCAKEWSMEEGGKLNKV